MNRDRSDPPARGTLPMPSGWFRICLSEELKPGRVSVFAIHGLGIGVSARCPPPFVPETAHDWPVPWGALTRVQARFIHRYMVADVLQDEPIWAHRVPLDHPVLIPGDGPIGKFRRWVRQFYP